MQYTPSRTMSSQDPVRNNSQGNTSYPKSGVVNQSVSGNPFGTPEDDLGWQYAPVGYHAMPRTNLTTLALGAVRDGLGVHLVISSVLLVLSMMTLMTTDRPKIVFTFILFFLVILGMRVMSVFVKAMISYRNFYRYC